MKVVSSQLIRQGVLFNISIMIFNSFVTFYSIKYFHGIQGAILGNIILYACIAAGYYIITRANYKKYIEIKPRFFAGVVICLFASSLMQWKTTWLLLVGYALLGIGRGIYYCSRYLYEFAYIKKHERVKYAGSLSAWKSAAEIIVPFIIGYLFSIVHLPHHIYFGIFLTSAILLVLVGRYVLTLPEIALPPSDHYHYREILRTTPLSHILYLPLLGAAALLPFIAVLLEIQILQHESRIGMFQSATKSVTLVLLLLILHFFHVTRGFRQMITISIGIGVLLFFVPRGGGWLSLILFALTTSFLLPLLSTYQKSTDMHIIEEMSITDHSVLPAIILQISGYALIRVLLFLFAYFFLFVGTPRELLLVLTALLGIIFIAMGLTAAVIYTSPRLKIDEVQP